MPLKVLTALDHARTQYYHFLAIMIAGMGLFSDAYDLFSITPVMKIIGRIYYTDKDGKKPGETSLAILSIVVSIALLGTVFGQVVFGVLGDRMGRRRVYGLSLLIMVFSSVASGFSICKTRTCMLTSLCFFRFWLGVGIGGDYPLSATIMSEFANRQTRGSFIAAVFSMQGFGILASSAVTIVLTLVFQWATKKSDVTPLDTPDAADILWRVILMIGAIPAALTFYWRMGMPETARFTALVENDVKKANSDIARVLHDPNLNTIPEDSEAMYWPAANTCRLFSKQFLKKHGRNLFACAMAWLILDIAFYFITLFQSEICKPAQFDLDQMNVYEEAINITKFQAIMATASTIPGYWATVYFIDRIGRRKIQMMGFFFMAVFLFSLGGPYNEHLCHNKKWLFMILYGLTFFFSNFGPNTTTFIVPAELFPARFRSTCYGISGAAGKVGAIIGTVGFLWASKYSGIGTRNVLIILGGVCVVGLAFTYFFTPETKGRSLEENEEEEGQDSESNGHGSGVAL